MAHSIQFPLHFQPTPILRDIVIGEKLLDEALDCAKTLSNQCLVITTDAVASILPLIKEETLILPSGETIKSRAIKEKIEDALIKRGFGRGCCLIAIGGGTVLDLVGFVASTYCRGVSYISYPTTLLAMTDAAIGGKTGLNVELAKNWIGAFHFPYKLFIDLERLNSLSQEDYLYGFSEIVKHSLILDRDLFDFIVSQWDGILNRESALLQEVITKSCKIKIQVVQQDPYERGGYRRILNFGHTLAHAIETHSGYRCPHGQAVVMGMHFESVLAHQLGYLSSPSLHRIEAFLKKFPTDFPVDLPFELLKRDKKGENRVVILEEIGSVVPFGGEYTRSISETDYIRAFDAVMCPV